MKIKLRLLRSKSGNMAGEELAQPVYRKNETL
jgi:hypothetical protein